MLLDYFDFTDFLNTEEFKITRKQLFANNFLKNWDAEVVPQK